MQTSLCHFLTYIGLGINVKPLIFSKVKIVVQLPSTDYVLKIINWNCLWTLAECSIRHLGTNWCNKTHLSRDFSVKDFKEMFSYFVAVQSINNWIHNRRHQKNKHSHNFLQICINIWEPVGQDIESHNNFKHDENY